MSVIVYITNNINISVGKPIDVKKTDNPSAEEIDALHKKFMDELNDLFESQKHLYLKNSENIKLEIQ